MERIILCINAAGQQIIKLDQDAKGFPSGFLILILEDDLNMTVLFALQPTQD